MEPIVHVHGKGKFIASAGKRLACWVASLMCNAGAPLDMYWKQTDTAACVEWELCSYLCLLML
jgi:hypothetical protein